MVHTSNEIPAAALFVAAFLAPSVVALAACFAPARS